MTKEQTVMIEKAGLMARATKTSAKRPAVKQSNGAHRGRYISTHGSVGFVVREVWRLYARCLQPRIAREGVTIGMWFVLRMLWDEDGMTQRELGDRVGINGPTMVAALNSMERAGLVKRVHNQVDRRKINVFLTKRGRDLKSKLWPMAAEVLDLSLAGLSFRQVKSLIEMLTKIRLSLGRDHFG